MKRDVTSRKNPILLLSVALLLLYACLPVFSGTWVEEQTLEHDGLVRFFRYYLPDSLPPGGYPVLFILHGGGGDMRSFLDNGAHAEWPEIADENGLLLIVPNGVDPADGGTSGEDQQWNDCRADAPAIETGADDVGFVSALIDWAGAEFEIAPERIYVTGSSNGGMMSYRLAFELGNRIAAIAPFIANLPEVSECSEPDHPISLFICNGSGEERYMPWDGGCVFNEDCTRGRVTSAAATRDYWLRFLNTTSAPVESIDYADIDPNDDTTAHSDLYDHGFEGSEVIFYTIQNGGHVTPSIEHKRSRLALQLLGLGLQNHDIEGARQAWAFLSRQRLTAPGAGTSPGLTGMLQVGRTGVEKLLLEWAGDCGSGQNYGIYRGDLTAGYDSLAPEPGYCSLGQTQATLDESPLAADFFLVVPNDTASEGAYGHRSDGSERPPAQNPCLPQESVDTCVSHRD